MLNKALESPRIRPFTLDEDMSLDHNTLRGIDIFADGDLHVTDIDGNEATVTFTNVAPFVRWVLQIRTIHTTGTTISIDDLVGLR
jgi:hypothetical protein